MPIDHVQVEWHLMLRGWVRGNWSINKAIGPESPPPNDRAETWVLTQTTLPPPITIPLALDELSHHGLNGSELHATKQLQIVSATDWYSDGTFNVERSLDQLAALPPLARQLGYASVRAVGGPGPFVSESFRQDFMRYERQATAFIADAPFIAVCCYASSHSLATDMFAIMNAHPGALLRTRTGWASI